VSEKPIQLSGAFCVLALICAFLGMSGQSATAAAQYAALVMDARSGKVVHSRNADRRLHPASLTKMMTLYVTFEAIERGEISVDSVIRVSKNASREPRSKLGLRAGQKIKLRYLIRATAVKSANDAATAIAEAISGSEAAFARRMTATAKAMGMTKTTFKNAHGLTANGHLSTARDMAVLGRRLFYDHNDYYNIFKRMRTSTGNQNVSNTNRRLLSSYRGADGIKTGYTRAAGYNLVASARRGNERIIVSLFGGKSVGWRTARIKELLDMGFRRAPSQERVIKPHRIPYIGNAQVASLSKPARQKLPTSIKYAYLPQRRPSSPTDQSVEALVARAVMDEEIEDAVAAAVLGSLANLNLTKDKTRMALPRQRPARQMADTSASERESASKTVVVAKSNDKSWAIHLGTYGTRNEAERLLLQTALQEVTALDGALRKIDRVRMDGTQKYRARFVGLTQKDAQRACSRLNTQTAVCASVSPLN
jgi:D-alanyl-D-alanine carboxypeptidase